MNVSYWELWEFEFNVKDYKLLAHVVHVYDPKSGAWGARELYSATKKSMSLWEFLIFVKYG